MVATNGRPALDRCRRRGFVLKSFAAGLDVDEMFFHAMAGREGIKSKTKQTASSGYVSRKLIRMTEDHVKHHDATIRDNHGVVVSFPHPCDRVSIMVNAPDRRDYDSLVAYFDRELVVTVPPPQREEDTTKEGDWRRTATGRRIGGRRRRPRIATCRLDGSHPQYESSLVVGQQASDDDILDFYVRNSKMFLIPIVTGSAQLATRLSRRLYKFHHHGSSESRRISGGRKFYVTVAKKKGYPESLTETSRGLIYFYQSSFHPEKVRQFFARKYMQVT